jgi:hypothetical protein
LFLPFLALAACVGSGEGVPNDQPDPEAVPQSYQEIQSMIFEPMCAQPCHHGGAAPMGMSLEAQRALANLVGVASVEVPAMLRVAPGQPDQSYLVTKLAPSDPRRIGSRMPRTGPPYASSRQISAIRRWITAGATADWEDDSGDADAAVVPPPPDAPDAPDAGADGG